MVSRRAVLQAVGLALLSAPLMQACGAGSTTEVAKTAASVPVTVATVRPTSAIATSAPSSAAAAQAPAGASRTLEISSWLGQEPSKQAYQQLFAAYAKVAPGVHLKQLVVCGHYASKLTALLAGGTPPDLAEVNWLESQALTDWTAQQKKQFATPAHIELVYDIATKYGKPVQVLPNDDDAEAAYTNERALILANKENAQTGMTKACEAMMAVIKQAQG